MRVLVAFDKFKDALSSPEACAIAGRALSDAHPDWQIDLCPLTDGGEGFCDILTRSIGGDFESVSVTGPRDTPVNAPIGFAPLDKIPAAARALLSTGHTAGRIAIVEMASASGLALLPASERDLWQTTSLGTGELIRVAADRGAAAILLGIGGSATNDLGLGALAALGLNPATATGERVHPPIPAHWERVARLSSVASNALSRLPPIRIACDVSNPLLGPRGATAVYGPQKGLRAEDRARFENAAARLALLLCHHCGQPDSLMDAPGTGAAGGISFGLMAAAGAQLLPGFDLVTAWLDLDRRLAAADLVLTGEGRFDDSSLEGKGPGAVAARAAAAGKRAHVFAGQIALTAPTTGFQAHAISPANLPLPEALTQAGENLARAVTATFSDASH